MSATDKVYTSSTSDEKDVLINALRRQVENLKAQVATVQAKDKKIEELESLLKVCSKAMDWGSPTSSLASKLAPHETERSPDQTQANNDGKSYARPIKNNNEASCDKDELPMSGETAESKEDQHDRHPSSSHENTKDPKSTSSSKEKLVEQNFDIGILRFEEDSPKFRAEIAKCMENTIILEHNIEQLIDASRKWRKRVRDLQEAECVFAKALANCKMETSSEGEDFFGISTGIFGEILLGMAEARETAVKILEAAFTEGIESFAQQELEPVRDRHKAVTKALGDYQSALTSFLNVKYPPKHKNAQQQNQFNINLAMRESDAIVAFEQYELARLDLVSQINRVRIKKQNELAQSVVQGLFAIQTSIHQDYERIVRYLPDLRRQQNIFPSTSTYLQQCESAFVQIRFELNRKLCRSIRLYSKAADATQDIDLDGRPDIRHEFARHALQGQPKLAQLRSASSSSMHVRSQSASPNSADALRRTVLRTHRTHDKGKPQDNALPHQRSLSDEGRKLRALDSFILLRDSPAMTEILHTPDMLICFIKFLIKEGKAAEISFWLDAERYRTLEDKFLRHGRAKAIMEKYIDGDIDLHLTFNRIAQLRTLLDSAKERPTSVTRSFFDLAQREVLDNIKADAYTQFLRSDQWLTLAYPESSQQTTLLELKGKASGSSAPTNLSHEGTILTSVYDPTKLEQLIPAYVADSLHLIDFDTSSARQQAVTVRCLLDNKSRVIVNGPYDANISDAFNIEYQPSVALGRLEDDLHNVYRASTKTLIERGLWSTDNAAHASPPSLPRVAAMRRHSAENSTHKTPSRPPLVSTSSTSKRNLNSSNHSASSKSEVRARPLSRQLSTSSIPPLAHLSSMRSKPSHSRKASSSFFKDRIKTWAAKTFKHDNGGSTGNSSSHQRLPVYIHEQVALEAAQVGKHLGDDEREDNVSAAISDGEDSDLEGSLHRASKRHQTHANEEDDGEDYRTGFTREEDEHEDEDDDDDDDDDDDVNDEDDDDDDGCAIQGEDDVKDDEFAGGSGRPRGYSESERSSSSSTRKSRTGRYSLDHTLLPLDLPSLRENGDGQEKQDQFATRRKVVAAHISRTSPVVKAGYLRKRSSKMRKTWKRRWFVLQGGQLFYLRDHNGTEEQVFICECMFAMVREADSSASSDLPFCFEILSPNRRTYIMQAENEMAMRSWMDTIRTSTERLITDFGGQSQSSSHPNLSCATSKNCGSTTPGQLSADPDLLKAQRKNPSCADCGSPQPDWASINLGILLCIECSGIHRSLGVHVSKVRSLTLDSWSEGSKAVINAIGNDAANALWESDLQTQHQWEKPTPQASRKDKEDFIRAKYAWKLFMKPDLQKSVVSMDDFREVCAHGDSLNLLNFIICHPPEKLSSSANGNSAKLSQALHIVVARGDLASCEILLQNGLRQMLNMRDSQGRSPADIATAHKHLHLLPMFSARIIGGGPAPPTAPTGAA